MSHGTFEDGRQKILFSDGELVDLSELLRPIMECPQLLHKPKLIFVQACRG